MSCLSSKSTIRMEKAIKYIEALIHCDASCNEKKYRENMSYMESAIDVCSEIEKNSKFKHAEADFLSIVLQLQKQEDILIEAIHSYSISKTVNKHTKEIEERKLASRVAEFYSIMGDILRRTKIMDSLVKRHNNTYTDIGLNYLRVNTDMALKEFDVPRQLPDVSVSLSKLAFYLNKLAKYIDYTHYYGNYKKDILTTKVSSDRRIKHISKLKTDFIETLHMSTTDVDFETVDDELDFKVQQYESEYKRLFGEYFGDLDLKQDLEKCIVHHEIKSRLYELKNDLSILAIAKLYCDYCVGKMPKGITHWGITEDDSDRYIFGMYLYGYPQHLTMHMSTGYLNAVAVQLKEQGIINPLSASITFPRYQTRRMPNGIVVPTNILVPSTPRQRDELAKHIKMEPDNEFIQSLHQQTTNKEQAKTKEVLIFRQER